MAKFSSSNQPANRGRKRNTTLKTKFSGVLVESALEQLTTAVGSGESWAITLIINRVFPALKAVTPVDSKERDLIAAQTELTKLKAKEIADFEERLLELERAAK